MYPQTTPYAFANPYQNLNPSNFQTNNYQPQQVVKVHGKSGADTYQMMPNSSALLLDETEPIIYLAQTDGAGYKTVTAYDIVLHKEAQPVNVQDLEQRISRLEEMMRNESNSTDVKQRKSEQVKSSSTNGSNS